MAMVNIHDREESVDVYVRTSTSEIEQRQQIDVKYQLEDLQLTAIKYRTVRSWALANGYSDMGEGAGADEVPVTMITWFDALLFCNAYNEMLTIDPCYWIDGRIMRAPGFPQVDILKEGYRLPFEKEWRYGAKEIPRNCQTANLPCTPEIGGGDECPYCLVPGEEHKLPEPPGQRAANSAGLYDVIGNVLEWCWDADDSEGKANPQYRAVRGSACCFSDMRMGVNDWQVCNVNFKLRNIGMRMAKSVVEIRTSEGK